LNVSVGRVWTFSAPAVKLFCEDKCLSTGMLSSVVWKIFADASEVLAATVRTLSTFFLSKAKNIGLFCYIAITKTYE
jgi:hypothetical protein